MRVACFHVQHEKRSYLTDKVMCARVVEICYITVTVIHTIIASFTMVSLYVHVIIRTHFGSSQNGYG